MFWVFYLSPCHVTQVQQHCCICPQSEVSVNYLGKARNSIDINKFDDEEEDVNNDESD
jgi:hypothetical protein